MSKCHKCGTEEIDVCPDCGQPVEVYSRVVGYLRPISCWNDGKAEEFRNRVDYTFWKDKKIAETDESV